jgi:hypothetical protein
VKAFSGDRLPRLWRPRASLSTGSSHDDDHYPRLPCPKPVADGQPDPRNEPAQVPLHAGHPAAAANLGCGLIAVTNRKGPLEPPLALPAGTEVWGPSGSARSRRRMKWRRLSVLIALACRSLVMRRQPSLSSKRHFRASGRRF